MVAAEPRRPKRSWRDRKALSLLGSSVLLFVITGLLLTLTTARAATVLVGFIGFGLAALGALFGTGFAIRDLARLRRARRGAVIVTAGIVTLLANLFMSGTGALAALLSTVQFTRGRQLRKLGRVLLPRVRPGDAWAHLEIETLSADLPAQLAEQWRENGRTEHASIAAFARLTLDLMALGAPPRLVAAANLDALDELRHTELCFSLAKALDGKAESPAAFPAAQHARTLPRLRTLALAQLAVDSLVDGALHEGVSARIIAKLAKRCEIPAIREVLREIAADEGRHAAHGFDVVNWCLQEGGAPVAHALLGAVRMLPKEMQSELPPAARSGEWERFGIHGSELERDEYVLTRAHLANRVRILTEPYFKVRTPSPRESWPSQDLHSA
jgi:hypothetical protein